MCVCIPKCNFSFERCCHLEFSVYNSVPQHQSDVCRFYYLLKSTTSFCAKTNLCPVEVDVFLQMLHSIKNLKPVHIDGTQLVFLPLIVLLPFKKSTIRMCLLIGQL